MIFLTGMTGKRLEFVSEKYFSGSFISLWSMGSLVKSLIFSWAFPLKKLVNLRNSGLRYNSLILDKNSYLVLENL